MFYQLKRLRTLFHGKKSILFAFTSDAVETVTFETET